MRNQEIRVRIVTTNFCPLKGPDQSDTSQTVELGSQPLIQQFLINFADTD